MPKDHLVQLFTPPADARLRDRRFLAIRQQLIDQLRPADSLQLMDIDLTASDMLHLASLRQAMERVTSPRTAEDSSRTARKAEDHRRLIELIQWLVERGEESKLFDCDEEEARVLAPRLIETFRGLKRLVAEADAEMAEAIAERQSGTPEESEVPMQESDEEDPRRCRLLEIILPIEPALEDRSRTLEVLAGNVPLAPDDQIRWVALLKYSAENFNRSEFGLNEALAKAELAEREMLATLAQDPIKLALLHRCAAEVEQAIERRLKRLKPKK